jgi:hypothetical protein
MSPGAFPASIKLFQNCIDDSHFQSLMAGFEALDFRHNPRPELREFQIFQYILEEGLHRQAAITGAVSSRFHAKSLVGGAALIRWISQTPDKDVYVVNPWPQWPYAVFNTHARAGIIHGDMTFNQKCQAVLDRAGVTLNYLEPGRQHNLNHGMSSYWFGSAAFWEGFMNDVVHPVTRLSKHELGDELHAFLYSPLEYYGQAVHRPGALPFLLERATNLYIAKALPLSAAFYPRSRQEVLNCCLFPFERDLVNQFGDLVDTWDEEGRYPQEALAYFEAATRHSTHGWLAYSRIHALDFDHGDPRPNLPWVNQQADLHHRAAPEV